MKNCNWEEIHGFDSLNEYQRFVQWIEEQVRQDICDEVTEQRKGVTEWDDRYFKCKSSSEIWKLSCPDPGYFSGSWLPLLSNK